MGTLRAAPAVLAVVLAGSVDARAGTVSFEPFKPGDIYLFSATPGAGPNDLVAERSDPPADLMRFSDAAQPLVAGPNCWQVNPAAALCPPPAAQDEYVIRLLDGADHARVIAPTGTPILLGGDDGDALDADTLGTGARVYGEAGADQVSASGDGGAIADGGPGDDRVSCCGGQHGGLAGGGPGDDLIAASASVSGGMVVDGGPGDDTIVLRLSPAPRLSQIDAGAGDDEVTVTGSEQPPTINGSVDVRAGPGDDVIDVRGGGNDTVHCGDGTDLVRSNIDDGVAPDCEMRRIER